MKRPHKSALIFPVLILGNISVFYEGNEKFKEKRGKIEAMHAIDHAAFLVSVAQHSIASTASTSIYFPSIPPITFALEVSFAQVTVHGELQ